MNIESNRLSTFANWPSATPVEPIRIARAGFFYTGQGTEVQCFSCGGKISQWNYGDQVMWRHRLMDPHCPFVVNPQLSGNIPQALQRVSQPRILRPESSSQRPPQSSSNNRDSDLETSNDYGLTDEDEVYKSDILRQLSFTNWNDNSVSQEALVSAGFYHVGEGRLRCAWCGGELAPFRNFGSIGSPLEVHRMYFPRCSYAVALEAEEHNYDATVMTTPPSSSPTPPTETNVNQPQSSGAAHNERVVAAGSSWRSLGVVAGGPRHGEYAALATRLQTFSQWPADRPQEPCALAEAGFYYAGVDDQVRCFYCDGGLGKWEAGDVPWSEHAHWFPHCGYVLLVKGQEFVNSCRVRDPVPHTVNSDQLVSESDLNAWRTEPSVAYPISGSQLDEYMESSVVLAALGAGLDVARVRRALARRLRSTGLPYVSSEALIDGVLDEQLREECWIFAPQRCAQDIINGTLRELAPTWRLFQSSEQGNETGSRSESDSSSPSPSPPPSSVSRVVRPKACQSPQPSQSDDVQSNSSKINKNTSTQETDASPAASPKREVSLEEENRQLKEARLCKVCMDNEVSVVFLPCGHLVSCARCGAALAACPLCRAAVRALVRTYLA